MESRVAPKRNQSDIMCVGCLGSCRHHQQQVRVLGARRGQMPCWLGISETKHCCVNIIHITQALAPYHTSSCYQQLVNTKKVFFIYFYVREQHDMADYVRSFQAKTAKDRGVGAGESKNNFTRCRGGGNNGLYRRVNKQG